MYNFRKNFLFIFLNKCFYFFYNNESLKYINFSVILFLCFIFLFFFYIKKTGLVNTTKTSNSITLLEQFYLTAHQKIIIIKIRKVNLVLGVTEKNINFLYILPSSIKKNYN